MYHRGPTCDHSRCRRGFPTNDDMRQHIPWWIVVLFVVALSAAKFCIGGLQSAHLGQAGIPGAAPTCWPGGHSRTGHPTAVGTRRRLATCHYPATESPGSAPRRATTAFLHGRGGSRTRTRVTPQGILSPQRLPFRHSPDGPRSRYRRMCGGQEPGPRLGRGAAAWRSHLATGWGFRICSRPRTWDGRPATGRAPEPPNRTAKPTAGRTAKRRGWRLI